MQLTGVATSPVVAAASSTSPQTVAVAKKALDQIKRDGEQAVALIQAAAPPDLGRLLNVIA